MKIGVLTIGSGGLALVALAVMLIVASSDWGDAGNVAKIVGWVLLVLVALFDVIRPGP